MKIYIARQPIYNSNKSLFGYELLHRDSDKNSFSNIDEEVATRELAYNVLAEFYFYSLVDNKYGFINFTKKSLMSDLPILFNPNNIVIEILENIVLDNALIDKVRFLKEKGYTLALDDFIDDGTYDEIMPYIDIIKVEYNLLDSDTRKNIAKKYKGNKILIAERIETEEEFNEAVDYGYNLFQGYYFSKPLMMSIGSINIASSTYLRIWNELSKDETNFNDLEDIIKLDVGLTYKLFKLVNTPIYYRGHSINSIKQALLRLGLSEAKKWAILLLLRDISNTDDDEFAKISLIRALFMEKVIIKLGYRTLAYDAYIIGLFSMIDNILDMDMSSIIETLGLSDNIKNALINKDGILYEALKCIKDYEIREWDKVDNFKNRYNLNEDIILKIYLEALKYADDMFKIAKN